MIIVSQDKDEIINFDNISSIYLVDMWDDRPGQVIKADYVHGNTSTLGYYKNEDRAKEVLIEIMKNYANAENYKHFNREITAEQLNNMQESLIYEMPKE